MQKKSLLSLLLVAVITVSAQPKKLSKLEFASDIIDQWWSVENKEAKLGCEMRIIVIRSAGFELNCINWADGFLGNKCAYDLIITDNFFEIKPKSCESNNSPGFLYGYLSEANQLYILLRKKQLALSPALLSEKDWIKFEKIKN